MQKYLYIDFLKMSSTAMQICTALGLCINVHMYIEFVFLGLPAEELKHTG